MHSLNNTSATIFGGDTNNPPQLLHLLESVNITRDLKPVAEMMLTFILDPEHPQVPPHIKECERHTVRAKDGNLRLRAWKTRLDQPEPNLALLRRLGSAVN